MFFVTLTGQIPFSGSPMSIIHAALSQNVPLAHTVRMDIPPVLSLIIDKLTRKVRGTNLCMRLIIFFFVSPALPFQPHRPLMSVTTVPTASAKISSSAAVA